MEKDVIFCAKTEFVLPKKKNARGENHLGRYMKGYKRYDSGKGGQILRLIVGVALVLGILTKAAEAFIGNEGMLLLDDLTAALVGTYAPMENIVKVVGIGEGVRVLLDLRVRVLACR